MFHDMLKSLYTTYYQWGFYGNGDIARFVRMQLIGPEDYYDITGQNYPEASTAEE